MEIVSVRVISMTAASSVGDAVASACIWSRVDTRIREVASPSHFIWIPRVEKVYPRTPYWYLYVLP